MKKEVRAPKIMKNHEHNSELVRNEQKLATVSVELSSLKSQVEELLLTNAVMSMFHSQSFDVPLLMSILFQL